MESPNPEDLTRLREGHIIEQLIIVKKFGQMHTPEVIHPLVDVVSQGREELIEEVAEAFYNLRDLMLPVLRSEITNENCFVRWTIALTIQKIKNPDYYEMLIPALGIGYEPVIKIITECLHQFRPERFSSNDLSTILQSLTLEEKERVGYYTIRQFGVLALDTTETLFALKTAQGLRDWDNLIVPLLKVSHHHDYRVRKEAQHILNTQFRHRDIFEKCEAVFVSHDNTYDFDLPENDNHELYLYAIEGFGFKLNKNLEKKARKLLKQILQNGTLMEKVFALKGLEELKNNTGEGIDLTSNIKEGLGNLLKTVEAPMRLSIIQSLSRLGEDWALSAISAHLEDTSPNIRLAVINGLMNSSIKSENVLDKAAFLLTDYDFRIRRATLQLFWKLDPTVFGLNEGDIISRMPPKIRDQLLNRLIEGLKNGPMEYRNFSAFWLGVLRYQPAFPLLISNLSHPSNDVKIRMIVSLGIFGDTKAIAHLVPFIEHTNSQIQRKAIESIGSLGLDGLHELIHQLFRKGEHNTPFLEDHIMTFGGRIINYISQEIESETSAFRKKKLQEFMNRVSQKYQVKSSNDFDILL